MVLLQPNVRVAPGGPNDSASLLCDQRGVTAVEYGIVATFLCLTLLGIFSRFGGVLTTMFNGVGHGI